MKQHPQNQRRAQWAARALFGFSPEIDEDFRSEAVCQLLSTLGHYCDAHGLNYDRLSTAALRQWEKERQANAT